MLDVTEQAKAVVGPDAPDDWKLQIDTYVAKLPSGGGTLRRILEHPEITKIIGAYRVADRAAVRARDFYKRLASWSAFASFAAIFIAAVLLLAHARAFGSVGNLAILSVIQGAMLVLSFVLANIVVHFSPFDRWMRERATAEHERVSLFNRVMLADEPARAGELPALPLKLEFFRRFQLNVQRGYYKSSGAKHRRAAIRAALFRWVGAVLICASAAPVVGNFVGADWYAAWTDQGAPNWVTDLDFQQRTFLALSTVGAALQGLLAALLLINQDERNASRYAATSENLETLASTPLVEACKAAASGDDAAVGVFAALVQDQISSEHRDWVRIETTAPTLSLERLRQANLPWAR